MTDLDPIIPACRARRDRTGGIPRSSMTGSSMAALEATLDLPGRFAAAPPIRLRRTGGDGPKPALRDFLRLAAGRLRASFESVPGRWRKHLPDIAMPKERPGTGITITAGRLGSLLSPCLCNEMNDPRDAECQKVDVRGVSKERHHAGAWPLVLQIRLQEGQAPHDHVRRPLLRAKVDFDLRWAEIRIQPIESATDRSDRRIERPGPLVAELIGVYVPSAEREQ